MNRTDHINRTNRTDRTNRMTGLFHRLPELICAVLIIGGALYLWLR